MEIKFTDENFEQEVISAKSLVLVDFYADWCGPCKMMAPIIEALAKEYQGRVKIGKLNVDESPQMSAKYSVMSIPTFLFFKEGDVVEQIQGVVSQKELQQKLDVLK